LGFAYLGGGWRRETEDRRRELPSNVVLNPIRICLLGRPSRSIPSGQAQQENPCWAGPAGASLLGRHQIYISGFMAEGYFGLRSSVFSLQSSTKHLQLFIMKNFINQYN